MRWNATTSHVPNQKRDMAALVEFNVESFAHQPYLNNLQHQIPLATNTNSANNNNNNNNNNNPRIATSTVR